MGQRIPFSLYGLNCQVNSASALFGALCQAKFAGFSPGATCSLLDHALQIDFERGDPPALRGAQRLSEQVWRTERGGRIVHAYLKTSTTIDYTIERGLVSRIGLYHRSHPAFALVNLTQRHMLRRQLFQNLIKQYVEQAAYHMLAASIGGHCLHASAVEKDGRATLLCGLNGVGKSTLAQWLVKHRGYRSFADNYVLVGSDRAYLAPDVLRLGTTGLHALALKSRGTFGFGKRLLPLPRLSDLQQAPVQTICWIEQDQAWGREARDNDLFQRIKHHEAVAGEAVELSPLAHLLPSPPDTPDTPAAPAAAYAVLRLGPLDELSHHVERLGL